MPCSSYGAKENRLDIMGLSLYLFMLMRSLFLLSCSFLLAATNSSSSTTQPLCHESESSALLQFKHSFVINKFASSGPSAYPKVESWKLKGEYSDCCSWHGVECDEVTGHVIGLDLSSSLLYGCIDSNSSLFNLVHLQSLNLADNHFNYSQIPSGIGHLPMLVSLNLSLSSFSGQIPSEISKLSMLTSLDLSKNFYGRFLEIQNPSLRNLVQNLTNLKELRLSEVYIPTAVPDILANMSSLIVLDLRYCGLHGEFPKPIFLLPNLQKLSVRLNRNLTGSLPEFQSSSCLEVLDLDSTNFSSKLPHSIGNLQSLNYLDLSFSNFTGTLPASLGNLTQLTFLDLRQNNFSGQIPSSLANLSKLISLSLGGDNFDAGTLSLPLEKLSKLTNLCFGDMNIHGEIPLSLANLTRLSSLSLSRNEMVGQFPSWLTNLTQLTILELDFNQLQGTIPSSFNQLKRLESLNLAANHLSGTLDLGIFLKLENMTVLELSYNKLTLLMKNSSNATIPKLKALYLGACNLREFPEFLRFQDGLIALALDNNKIHGQIPTWVWNSSKETLATVDLTHNFLTGFDQDPAVIPWHFLQALFLSFNRLQGSLPIPSPTSLIYEVADNLLSGEIPPSICCSSSLSALDLSNNNFSGTIPPCLAKSGDSLLALNLSHNSLQGIIPPQFTVDCKLMMIDLNHNQLQGKVPRSLANCRMLEIVVLGNNQIGDTFPYWLGALPQLQVLVLRSNKFHGPIDNPQTIFEFPKLRIIDLSHNGFSGKLPSEYFKNWNAMKMVKAKKLAYMQATPSIELVITVGIITYFFPISLNYGYSITMAYKGTQRLYEKIQNILVLVDLSNNKFRGEIPESLGILNGLEGLNLSNNNLTGAIPLSLANLTELESLDLSQNKLSGEIPQLLTQLTFLAFLNISYNHLTGPIPQGKQFDTFENSSYEGNTGLCGQPLSKSCGNSVPSTPLPSSFQGDDSKFPTGVDWIVIFMGYGSGLVNGLVLGHTLTTRYHQWFVRTFGRGKQTQRRQ